MLENLSSKVTTISANTQVVFTMKNFSALIGGILALFFGFYQLVVVPKIEGVEKQLQYQVHQNQIFQTQLNEINASIGNLNLSVRGLTQKNDGNTYHLNVPTSGQFDMSFYQNNVDSFYVENLLSELNNSSNMLKIYSIP